MDCLATIDLFLVASGFRVRLISIVSDSPSNKKSSIYYSVIDLPRLLKGFIMASSFCVSERTMPVADAEIFNRKG